MPESYKELSEQDIGKYFKDRGSVWKHKKYGGFYMLVSTSPLEFRFVNLDSGNRLSDWNMAWTDANRVLEKVCDRLLHKHK